MKSVPSWVLPGAKCACIRDFREAQTVDDLGYTTLPEKGRVYTVKSTVQVYGQVGLILREFEPDHYFDLRGFRPLVTRSHEQDLAIFRPILDQVPVDA